MLAKLKTFALVGIDAVPVEVEVDASGGVAKMILVGLPEMAVKESIHRIERALVNLGYDRPRGRTVLRRPRTGAAGVTAAAVHDDLMLVRATAALLDVGTYVAAMGAVLTALAVDALLRSAALPGWTLGHVLTHVPAADDCGPAEQVVGVRRRCHDGSP